MKYATPAAFRAALDQRLKAEADRTGLNITRLRKRVAFELRVNFAGVGARSVPTNA